jgi:hypothetical protein
MGFIKVRFTSVTHGSTAGLIFPAKDLYDMSLTKLSRHWPVSEAMKMRRVEMSDEYDTWEGAFNHSFDEGK